MRICEVEELTMDGITICDYLETNLSEHEENQSPPTVKSDPERLLSRVSLPSIPRLPGNFKPASRRLFLFSDPARDITSTGIRLDLLSHLPPEIAVHILRYLHPRHLCRVVQVSKRWCRLAQFGTLRTKRLRYIHHKREKYLQSKENVVPRQRHSSRTPRILTRASLSTNSGNSPLTSIQSSRNRHTLARNSPHSGSVRDGETPVRLPHFHHSFYHSERRLLGSPILKTPDNSSLGRHGAMEDDAGYMVRRCLFPHADASAPKHPPNYPTSCDDSIPMETELGIKTSASKRRLKRL